MKQDKHIFLWLIRLSMAGLLMTAGLSCVKQNPNRMLYYQIENHSDYRIKVVFYDFWYHRQYYPNSGDSVVYYNPGETRDLLVVYNNLSTYYNSSPENQDTLQGIHVLEIFRNDSVQATKNYRLTRYWTYSATNSYKAVYQLEITNESFMP